MKGNTMRKNGKCVAQSIIKVPKELIKLQQDVELAINCFFVNKQIFFFTYSTKTCFTTVTHLGFRMKAFIWEALHGTYKMYLLHSFRIVVIAGERTIQFLKEKIRSLRHSLPFERVPGIMVVHMILHIVKFVNGFP
jgi:hypothetical protein